MAKTVKCIFCNGVLIHHGNLNFPGISVHKKEIRVCIRCHYPRTIKDLNIMKRWERETGMKVYEDTDLAELEAKLQNGE